MDVLGERFPAVLAGAVAGDPAAFAELWRACHPPLLRYLRVLSGAEAEDIASETWLKVMRGLGSFSGDEQAFRSWLTVVARNHARDIARRAARRPEVLTDDAQSPAESAPDAADLALERLGTEQALRLLATLPPAQAEMVALRVIVGLEPVEVARVVDRTPGAVRVAVHRGLAALAKRLQPPPPPADPSPSVIDLRAHAAAQAPVDPGDTGPGDSPPARTQTPPDETLTDDETFTRRHG